MRRGHNRGSKKRKLYENMEKFINFVEIGTEYAICIIDLGGMDAPDYIHVLNIESDRIT